MSYTNFVPRDELLPPLVFKAGYRADGLGAEPDCAQPVSTAERDAIRDSLNRYTRDYMGQRPAGQVGGHWHEGHPDIKAALADLLERMIGLTQRPKLLRCNAEARNRATTWVGQLQAFLKRIKTGGQTYVPATFQWSFYRGPNYTIRASTDAAVRNAQAAFFAKTAYGKPLPLPGEGQTPPTTPQAQAAAPPVQTPAVTTPTGQPVLAPGAFLPPEVEGIWQSVTTGEIAGIPKAYLAYGVLALLAYNMVFGKRR